MDKAHLAADALCDFAEGLMSPGDRHDAEAHLAGCADCRRQVAAMQGYFQEMSGLETLKAPDRFLTKVHARIAKASPWRRLLAALSSPRLLPAPLAGLAVILVGVYFAFLSPRLAEQALSESQAVPASPAPEPSVQLAKKKRAAPSPQTAASGEAAAEPLSQVAMSPAAPGSVAEERIAAVSKAKANRSNRATAGKPAPARPKADVAAQETTPVETEALALAEAPEPAKESKEAKAEGQGAGGLAGNREHQLSEEQVKQGFESASAVYILDNTGPAGGDAVLDQIASSRGPADRVKDVPAPAPAAPSAKSASRDEDQVQFDSEVEESYSAPTASIRKRSVPAAAAPPATTPKPWAPLGYTLKAKVGEAVLRGGLTKLGVKVLRQDDETGRRYELEVPATLVIDLEAYLGGLGILTPSQHPLPGRKSGAPIRLTLLVVAP